MNDQNSSPDHEQLEPPLAAAVQAVLGEPVPEVAVQRVAARARQLASDPTVTLAQPRGGVQRSMSGRVLRASVAIAAALLVMALGGLLLRDNAGDRAFAQMVERVNAASSVQFKMSLHHGRQLPLDCQMYIAENRLRIEPSDPAPVCVADLERKKALYLDVHRRVAQAFEVGPREAEAFANPIDQLRNAATKDAEQIGQEILDGRRMDVFRLRNVALFGLRSGDKDSGEMLVSVDVASGLPAKIVIRDPSPQSQLEVRFNKFVWNEPIDHALFSLEIPKGFKEGTVVITPGKSKPVETQPVSPADLAAGILSRDGVATPILWSPDGATITAQLRDQETVPAIERQIDVLRQWDVDSGQVLWFDNKFRGRTVAMSPDGRLLATLVNRAIELRDAKTGKETRAWAVDQPLSMLNFSPDGKTLAAGIAEWGPYGGNGGKMSGGYQIWNVEQGSLVRSVSDDDKPTTFVKYSRDGKYLATTSDEGPIKLWNPETGELARVFPGHGQADFSPDGRTIACVSLPASGDKLTGQIDLYNLKDAKLVRSFVTEKGPSPSTVLCVIFSPDGRLLATTNWNGTVTLWNVATGERATLTDHKGGVLTAVFSPDGASLATGSEDMNLRLRKLPKSLIETSPEK